MDANRLKLPLRHRQVKIGPAAVAVPFSAGNAPPLTLIGLASLDINASAANLIGLFIDPYEMPARSGGIISIIFQSACAG